MYERYQLTAVPFVVVSSVLASTIQYFISSAIRIPLPARPTLTVKLINRIRQSSVLELLIIRLSGAIPYKVVNVVCGLVKYKYSKFFVASLVAAIPFQLVYLKAGEISHSFGMLLKGLGFNQFSASIASLSVATLLCMFVFKLIAFVAHKNFAHDDYGNLEKSK